MGLDHVVSTSGTSADQRSRFVLLLLRLTSTTRAGSTLNHPTHDVKGFVEDDQNVAPMAHSSMRGSPPRERDAVKDAIIEDLPFRSACHAARVGKDALLGRAMTAY